MNEPKSLSEMVKDLAQLIVRYIRQEVGRSVQDSVIAPLDALRNRVVFTIIAAFAFGVALIFTGNGLFLLLETAVGQRWIAMLIVAALFGAAGFFLFRKGMRSGQRKTDIARSETAGHPASSGPDQGEGHGGDSLPANP